jgi:glycosyltransferase involved in cell wall biosynthesis
MKLLIICPFFPYPLNTGIRIREYNLITRLASRHQIFLFSLIQADEELGFVRELEPYCGQVVAVRPAYQRPGAIDGRRTLGNVVCGIFDKRPIHFYRRPSPNVSAALEEVLTEQRFDLVLVETLFMTKYVLDAFERCRVSVPRVLIEHNVETQVQRREIALAPSLVKKVRKWVYWATFRGFERQTCPQFDHIIVVSEPDKQLLLRLCPELGEKQVTVIPNGVDARTFRPGMAEPKPDTLIYPGALTYHVNYDAVAYFLREIYPLIRSVVPEVHLTITGSYEGVALERLSLDGHVTLTGPLPAVQPHVAESTACIVPIRSGGGTRLKILEAMALGTPVVSTHMGAEGLEVTPNRHLLLASEPHTFAEQTVKLLREPALRARLRKEGRILVEEKYCWDRITEKLEGCLQELVDRNQL